MSEMDAVISEDVTAAPGEAAPAVEGTSQQGTCTDPAQTPDPVGTQTPTLEGQATPVLTGSPTTDSGYAEAASNRGPAETKEKETLRTASLHAQSSPPELQPSEPAPILVMDTGTNTQSGFEGEDMVATSIPTDNSTLYAIPVASVSKHNTDGRAAR